jgi:murein L,D-transpeptidase YafK
MAPQYRNRAPHAGAIRLVRAVSMAAVACLLASCASAPSLAPSDQPLSKDAMMLLGKKGMTAEAPIYVRIFKQESELEVWKARDDGRFYHFKTYPICNWSGELGPKLKQGDKQAPEGFYAVSTRQMNPNSGFYLAFNLGFPNAYDRAQNRTGDALMVHGKCKSAGCYAMTDALIEEIYALARDALKAGQANFQVHAFPFRMTDSNMAIHAKSQWAPFWATLKQGYDHFEQTRLPAEVAVCERKYMVNVKLPQSKIDPERSCPQFERPIVEPFVPKPTDQQIAQERIVIDGPKTRDVASMGVPAASPAILGPASQTGLGFNSK